MDDLIGDRKRALALTPVSRETAERLDALVELLLKWQTSINLVAPSTNSKIWTRHVADSLQLLDLAPDARTWIDLGSGAGFPGLVVGCALAEIPGVIVHLVESNGKKAAFLREAVRLTGAAARVHAVRIGDFVESHQGHADIVTARALAGLKDLLDQSVKLFDQGTLGLFPKGQDAGAELTEATKYWNMTASLVPSRTDPQGRIVMVRGPARRQASVPSRSASDGTKGQ